MAETMTIRVDPSVHGAVKAIADQFDWTTSDVASTLLWIGLSHVNPELLPSEIKAAMFADAIGILGNWAAMAMTNPEKATDNLSKSALLLSKVKRRDK